MNNSKHDAEPFESSGHACEISGSAMNSDAPKSNETDMALGEQRLIAFFKAAGNGLAILDREFRFLQVNPSLAEMDGVSVDDHIGRRVSEVLPGFAEVLEPILHHVFSTGESVLKVELSGATPRKPGVERHFLQSFFPILGNNENPESLGVIMLEITERKHAEESLRESEERYRDLFENANDLIQSVASDGSLLYVNQAWLNALEYNACEWQKLKFPDLIHPDHREEFGALFRRVFAGEPVNTGTFEMVSKSGKSIIVEAGINPKTVDGKVVSLRCILRDITERKKLEAQFLRTQRMENIGTLAGGIAHDLNNILAPILMSVELLRMKITDEKSERMLKIIADSAQRGAEMVKQVLTFSRGLGGSKVSVQFKHLIKEMTSITRETFPKSISLQTRVASDLWQINGDVTQLHQVLLNLCVNARDAMPNGGTLTIQAGNFTADETFASMNHEAAPVPYVVLCVIDTGVGMSKATQSKIFEAFYTTKPLDKGTGLGLFTVRGIVRDHKGFITVRSEEGVGSTFNIYLPAALNEEPTLPAGVRVAPPLGQGELILVVDDEASVCSIVKHSLEMFGYRVVTASNGAQAVALCAQNKNEIQLVLLDMVMPIMDGTAAMAALETVVPGIKIITSSGSESEGRSVERMPHTHPFLLKPYTTERLLILVHEVLAAPGVPPLKQASATSDSLQTG